MAKVSVELTHIAWRDGRPRFNPGPALRRLGFKGEDLKHGDGRWFTLAEATSWITAREGDIAAARAARTKAGRTRAVAASAQRLGPSLEQLMEPWFQSPAVRGVRRGERVEAGLRAGTIKDYRGKLERFAEDHPIIWTSPLAAVAKSHMRRAFEQSWEKRGLASARGMMAVVSTLISWAMVNGLVPSVVVNPASRLKLPTAPPRLRVGTVPEIMHLIATADALGMPEIGDAIALGVWTGQRQNDRLALRDQGLVDGRRRFVQSKTGAIVEIPEAPMLAERLRLMRARRTEWTVLPSEVIADERTRRPFRDRFAYAARFARVRDEAAKAMPSLADFHDQDLRDTAVTWLARAGCDIIRIRAITGHELDSIHQILKHYLASHADMADEAIAKLHEWFGKEMKRGL